MFLNIFSQPLLFFYKKPCVYNTNLEFEDTVLVLQINKKAFSVLI